MKQTMQITQSNFTVLVLELEEAVKNGYTLVKEGENRPYHAIMGNFIVTLEKGVDEEKQEETCSPVGAVVEGETLPTEIAEKTAEVVVEAPVQPKPQQNQRGPKPKK